MRGAHTTALRRVPCSYPVAAMVWVLLGTQALSPIAAVAAIRLGMSETVVEVTTPAEIALRFETWGADRSDTLQVAGIELELQWNLAILDLERVVAVGPASDWFLEWNATRGSVRIAMVSVDGFAVSADPVEFLRLRFRTGPEPGQTAIFALPTPLFGSDLQRIGLETSLGNVKTVERVGGWGSSMGAIKAAFRGSGFLD